MCCAQDSGLSMISLFQFSRGIVMIGHCVLKQQHIKQEELFKEIRLSYMYLGESEFFSSTVIFSSSSYAYFVCCSSWYFLHACLFPLPKTNRCLCLTSALLNPSPPTAIPQYFQMSTLSKRVKTKQNKKHPSAFRAAFNFYFPVWSA